MSKLEERVETMLRLPPEMKEAVEKEARKISISFNAMVLYLIQKGLEEV